MIPLALLLGHEAPHPLPPATRSVRGLADPDAKTGHVYPRGGLIARIREELADGPATKTELASAMCGRATRKEVCEALSRLVELGEVKEAGVLENRLGEQHAMFELAEEIADR